MVKSDIEIARAATMKPILEVGAGLGIPPESLDPYGHYKAKISLDFLKTLDDKKDGKLILGSPAKVVRDLKKDEINNIKQSALSYQSRALTFQEKMKSHT